MTRHLLLASLGVLLVLFATTACQTASSPSERPADEVIGRPPPPEEDDPFFARALPAEAVPAEPTGQIGRPSPPPDPIEPEEPPVDERPVEEPPVEELPVSDGPREACFSCVRICPITNGEPDCGPDTDDLICGWGTHSDLEQAQLSAEAHCNATLDMARELPTYSEITGRCPPATCR